VARILPSGNGNDVVAVVNDIAIAVIVSTDAGLENLGSEVGLVQRYSKYRLCAAIP
jgi:hypothetical protein